MTFPERMSFLQRTFNTIVHLSLNIFTAYVDSYTNEFLTRRGADFNGGFLPFGSYIVPKFFGKWYQSQSLEGNTLLQTATVFEQMFIQSGRHPTQYFARAHQRGGGPHGAHPLPAWHRGLWRNPVQAPEAVIEGMCESPRKLEF